MATAKLLPVERPVTIVPAWAGAGRVPAVSGPPLIDAPLLAAVETGVALVTLALVLAVSAPEVPGAASDAALRLRLGLDDLLRLAVLATAWPVAAHVAGLYHAATTAVAAAERRRIVLACAAASVVVIGAPAWRSGGPSPTALAWLWPGITAGMLTVRAVRRAAAVARVTARRVLIVGTGPRAAAMAGVLSHTAVPRYEVAGFIDVPGATAATPEIARQVLARPDQLETVLMHEAIDEVFIALPVQSCYAAIRQAILACERVGVRVTYRADLVDTALARTDARVPVVAPDAPSVTLHMVPHDGRLVVKRALDIAGALAGLLLLSPVLLAAAAAIRLTSPGPIVFAQERYGLNRRRFRMFKFRTMVPDAERLQAGLEARNEAQGPVFKLAADPRITPVGRFLRRTSIDELPQLVNVLRGEMSLVGPRPLPLRDVRRFTAAGDMRRFSVRPGLTCLWQIGGRSTVGFAEWVRLDLAYIDHWSLALDLRILLRTIPAVLRGTGAH